MHTCTLNRLHFMRRTEKKCFYTNLLTIDVVFDFLAIVEFPYRDFIVYDGLL